MIAHGPLRFMLLAIGTVFLLAVPFVLNDYPQTLVTEILIFGLFAVSIDILAGFAGRVSLGHGAIFGMSSYIVAYYVASMGGSPWIGAVLGILGATVLAAIFGLLAARTSGVYFLLLTLALGMVIWGVAYRWTSVTGAENGILGVSRPDLVAHNDHFYYFVLGTVAVTMYVVRRFVHSPFGMALTGIKESPSRMRTLGYNVPWMLAIGFTVSGFFAGVAGVLGVFLNNFISPTSLDVGHSTLGLLMAILGGIGTIWGGFVGAAVIILLENFISFYTERWASILGVLFILTMLFAPQGLVGMAKQLANRRARRRNA